jgi:hypothetical protein
LTISITKATLTRWIVIVCILFCGSSLAVDVDVPKIMRDVTANREFLAGLSGHERYYLYDVFELRKDVFGVVLMDPLGIQETLVYDLRNGEREIIYRDAYIPNKKKRERMMRQSVAVADAVRLAQTAIRVSDGDMLLAGN